MSRNINGNKCYIGWDLGEMVSNRALSKYMNVCKNQSVDQVNRIDGCENRCELVNKRTRINIMQYTNITPTNLCCNLWVELTQDPSIQRLKLTMKQTLTLALSMTL